MTNAILRGKPDAGNPHVRFDEGEVASEKPRRGSLLYKDCAWIAAACLSAAMVTILGFSVFAFEVDDKLPAGNVVVEGVEGETVRVKPDLRDTEGPWFYWAFRVRGAAGRKLTFRFGDEPGVGSRGPAVSYDRGATWAWGDVLQSSPVDPRTKDHLDSKSFEWDFRTTDDEVWFSQTIPYGISEWTRFVEKHKSEFGRTFLTNVLCRTGKGRVVPLGRFGRLSGAAKHRVCVTARHHAQESSASYVMEGVLESFFGADDLGSWLRSELDLLCVPFVDVDGVVDGDQGKNRRPHDHCRDYNSECEQLYPAVASNMTFLASWRPTVVMDLHSPWLRGSWFLKNNSNEFIYQVGVDNPVNSARQRRFGEILERTQSGGCGYRQEDDYWFGRGWNCAANYAKGRTLETWAAQTFPDAALVTTFEIPFANARHVTLDPVRLRAFGRDIARALKEYLSEFDPKQVEIDGIYPHLTMYNDEGECGTGAVVPWAGDLWAVTYGPHCPLGSSGKLYQVKPDLTQIIRPESVGGTPANRIVHRETNQLLIGPYVIDVTGGVRVVPPIKMPGRLTGAARHLVDPSNKVYVATMESGLYELDLNTLSVNTLIRERTASYCRYEDRMPVLPTGWTTAPLTAVLGYHSKGLASGFGRVFVSNNGEDSDEARRNPFVPSGILAWWNEPGRDWTQIRRCQFTEVTTRDDICGNEHPESNPIWSLGWDAKSVILAVTTNGVAWSYYRLPKASHCYDGAHGWNTEWPRIRDVGFGDGTLLATMHGTFWKFPKDFSPANPNGIRPLSTYLKVIGDFCRWQNRIVFGCDDQAQSEFLGSRTLKKDAPKRDRSQSNLWFVKPEDLASFGPPSGEGWVWRQEDVRAGDISDPFLAEGYATSEFSFRDGAGNSVRYELLREGDWVRVKALEDAKGADAHFRYGPKHPEKLPAFKGFVNVFDDYSKVTYRFPNVNGDKTVICREVATERDLLYVGGVFYEVPADNAGGFAELRPIALADEPVRTLEAKLGLVYVNGKPMALDSLWKNGTAAAAYWLWRTFRQAQSKL